MLWTQEITRRLMEVIKTGIVVTDDGGVILFSNDLASSLFGYDDGGLNGLHLEDLFLPEDRSILLPNIMKLVRDGTGFDGEALLQKKDGAVFFVNLSTALYKDDSRSQELVIITLQDISRLKQMEKDKLEAERFAGLGVIADQISHQIRNPVASIGGFALRLAKDTISPADYSRYGGIIHGEAKRLEHIIDRLVEFTQPRSGEREVFSFAELFSRVSAIVDDRIKDCGGVLVVAPQDRLPSLPLFGDLLQLTTALSSIVINGIEADSDANEVNLTGLVTDTTAVVEVRDNGPGVTKEDLPFLFDPFFSTRFGHLGLGLTLAKRIVEEHRGRIAIEPQETGGTIVRVLLPRDRRRSVRTKAF
jgi:PAS domain S-box-containing protein